MHPSEAPRIHELDFTHTWYKPVQLVVNTGDIEIGEMRLTHESMIDLGDEFGQIPVSALADEAFRRARLTNQSTNNVWQPQLAAYVFTLLRKPQAMNGHFPITQALDKDQRLNFYKLAIEIAQKLTFDIRIIGERRVDYTRLMPPDVGFLIAGHLAEIFFFRTDILDSFFKTPKRFWLYITRQAYSDHGGVAGGMFNASENAIQLVLSRLYEGFYAPTPGVAPFVHELGHMLDHFASANGGSPRIKGLLPGLHPRDGSIYSAEAGNLFAKGKRIELERYLRRHHGAAASDDPLPIGHPYVFQNDGEFIAGYLEMFFRNPHYFADLNPDLYSAFSQLFRQDPRTYWREDFPFYIQQNRDFYLTSGKKPPAPNLTINAGD
jgi:hypothetical protein